MTRRSVAMIVHAYYDEDPRVRREAETLVTAGWEVDVFGLRRDGDPPDGMLRGVRVHRLDVQRHQGAPLGVYLWEYLDFFVRAAAAAVRAHRARRFALVQVHSIPDFLVFAALPLKLVGVPVVLDLHEAMPEFFRSRFPGAANGITRWLLEVQEVLSLRFANAVVTVNDALRERFRGRGVPDSRITVVANSPSADLFDPGAHPHRDFMEDGALRLIYAGALTPNYELDVVLEALALIVADRSSLAVHLDLYGRGDSEPALREQAAALGVAGRVTFHGRIPLEDVAAAIARSDVGLAPTRRNAQTNLSLPTKILEYAAMGKPVVSSDLTTVGRTFEPDTLALYRGGDARDLADAVFQLVDDPAQAARRVERSAARVAELSWERQAAAYLALLERLTESDPTGDGRS